MASSTQVCTDASAPPAVPLRNGSLEEAFAPRRGSEREKRSSPRRYSPLSDCATEWPPVERGNWRVDCNPPPTAAVKVDGVPRSSGTAPLPVAAESMQIRYTGLMGGSDRDRPEAVVE
jgi:hypothetical protein